MLIYVIIVSYWQERIVLLFEQNTYSVVNIFDVTLRPQLNATGMVEVLQHYIHIFIHSLKQAKSGVAMISSAYQNVSWFHLSCNITISHNTNLCNSCYAWLQIPEGNGSGVVWDEQGHIVTNYHGKTNSRKSKIKCLQWKLICQVSLLSKWDLCSELGLLSEIT